MRKLMKKEERQHRKRCIKKWKIKMCTNLGRKGRKELKDKMHAGGEDKGI